MTAFLCILAGLFLVWLADKAWKLPSRWTPADPVSYYGDVYLDDVKVGTYTSRELNVNSPKS